MFLPRQHTVRKLRNVNFTNAALYQKTHECKLLTSIGNRHVSIGDSPSFVGRHASEQCISRHSSIIIHHHSSSSSIHHHHHHPHHRHYWHIDPAKHWEISKHMGCPSTHQVTSSSWAFSALCSAGLENRQQLFCGKKSEASAGSYGFIDGWCVSLAQPMQCL